MQFFCVSARYVIEMCACKNNLYIPKHVYLNLRLTLHAQPDIVRFRVDVDLSSRSDFSDLRFCATSQTAESVTALISSFTNFLCLVQRRSATVRQEPS